MQDEVFPDDVPPAVTPVPPYHVTALLKEEFDARCERGKAVKKQSNL
jgi:hypothetical protein